MAAAEDCEDMSYTICYACNSVKERTANYIYSLPIYTSTTTTSNSLPVNAIPHFLPGLITSRPASMLMTYFTARPVIPRSWIIFS